MDYPMPGTFCAVVVQCLEQSWLAVCTFGFHGYICWIKKETRNNGKTNALIYENSPYLLQHAYNPVDWRPWSEDALEEAVRRDKPIFLSIGYSTCHWCHIMESESFENKQIANILNSNFIPIKVDREERPDIDELYMKYVQAAAGSGGWPMSVWLMPKTTYSSYRRLSIYIRRPWIQAILNGRSICKISWTKVSAMSSAGATSIHPARIPRYC